MRERHTQQKTISFTKSMYERIEKAANEFEVSFAEVVQECITHELDKLIDREEREKDHNEMHRNIDRD